MLLQQGFDYLLCATEYDFMMRQKQPSNIQGERNRNEPIFFMFLFGSNKLPNYSTFDDRIIGDRLNV